MRFSLIICVYNVARFIEKSLTNVLRQGFHEIIIVDDGSTDAITPAICDRIAASDNRINVIAIAFHKWQLISFHENSHKTFRC